VPPGRSRRPGGGRKPTTTVDATLLRDLAALVEPTAPGDPDSPLRWCCKSTRTLAVALQALGHSVSHTVVVELLHHLGYSLQGNVKTREGRQYRDRDAQFRYLAETVARAQRRGQPAISVDTNHDRLGIIERLRSPRALIRLYAAGPDPSVARRDDRSVLHNSEPVQER
jgi:hypothetical protein